MNHQAWINFRRSPSPHQVQAIADRLQFLSEVLPRYMGSDQIDNELDDLDLDLNTFLASTGDELTPWLIHSDWCADVDKHRIPEATRQLVVRALEVGDRKGPFDLSDSLQIVSELLRLVNDSDDEDGSVALLSALDCVAYHVLAMIGARRLTRLIAR